MYSKVASWTLVLAVNSELSELLWRLPSAFPSCSWILCFTLLCSALLCFTLSGGCLLRCCLAPAPHHCEHAQPLSRRLCPPQARWQDVQDLHTHAHTRTDTTYTHTHTHTRTHTTSATYPRLVVSSALCFTMLLVLDERQPNIRGSESVAECVGVSDGWNLGKSLSY